jgi:hypothetical protein
VRWVEMEAELGAVIPVAVVVAAASAASAAATVTQAVVVQRSQADPNSPTPVGEAVAQQVTAALGPVGHLAGAATAVLAVALCFLAYIPKTRLLQVLSAVVTEALRRHSPN